ncbi:MAG: hypothetical protein ACRCXT_09495 [Paraclostridium sp.]
MNVEVLSKTENVAKGDRKIKLLVDGIKKVNIVIESYGRYIAIDETIDNKTSRYTNVNPTNKFFELYHKYRQYHRYHKIIE